MLSNGPFQPFRQSGDANIQDTVPQVSDSSPLALARVPAPAAPDQPLPLARPSLVGSSQASEPRREQKDAQVAPLVSISRGVAPIFDNPLDIPLGLHERVTRPNQVRSSVSLANQARAWRPVHPMEQDQQQQQSSILFSSTTTDAPETIESLDPSDHNTTNTAYSASVPPRSRPTRSPTSYRPPPSQSQQQNPVNVGNPYYSSQQPQPQQYMSQPMSPAMYYPGYHSQPTSPNAYNLNQGYIGPPHTTVGPSMPVTPYTYSHIHPYAYHGIGGVTPTPLSHYPEHDSQQMHPHGTNMDIVTGYGAMVASTAPPFGYTIPAYAPTSTPVFTPQYTGSHPYQHYPQQSQPYSIGYGQSHPGHGPPSLNLSQQQQQQPSHQAQQASMHPPTLGILPHVPPSPVGYLGVSQAPPTRDYSPIVTSPSPGIPPNSGLGSMGIASPGSGMFSLGPSGVGSATLSARGAISGYGSGGSAENVNRNTSGSGSASEQVDSQGRRPSTLPADRFPSSTHGSTPATWPSRQEPEQVQVSGKTDRSEKADRSEWVMWVGNVPGDTTTEELRAFFSQAPDLASESHTTTDEVKPRDQEDSRASPSNKNARISNEEKDSGVASVFLISRSNCAFVNYTSEEALSQGVKRFNGKPLRSPQVDPRCPKLVCRVRKKSDDLKAGVGGQRGAGMHSRWVKEKTAAEAPKVEDAVDESDRPPLIRGGPLVDGKKSSGGSSVSFASTSSSLLANHFPVRYFILKSLSQYDLDLSVQRGLWATQAHNEETLEQAYRTSKTIYLIFSVNKSGEFFGYAKMDGPIKQVQLERTPSVEWASRDATTGSSSSRVSPVNTRGAQPTIQEEHGGAEASAAMPVAKSDKQNLEQENAVDGSVGADPRRFSSMPTQWVQRLRRSVDDYLPVNPDEKINPPAQHTSEPSHALHHLAVQEMEKEPESLQTSEAVPPKASTMNVVSSPHSLPHHPAHLFASVLQESPDPLTPGEDRKLHSLENAAPVTAKGHAQSSVGQSQPLRAARYPAAGRVGHDSAPAEMGQKHKALSASTPINPPETWDERRGITLWTHEYSIEEEDEGSGDDNLIEIPSNTQSLPPEPPSAISPHPGEEISDPLSPAGDPPPNSTTDALHSDPTSSAPRHIPNNGTLAEQLLVPIDNDKAAVAGGREEGWGTPFKVKWVRTDPLPFHRTRHLRNPWNHDREVKVSRDGTEIETTVGQRLIDEWERTDHGVIPGRAGLPPQMPLSPTNPTALTPIGSRGRGRGRAASGGHSHVDIR